jgi:chaperonin GroEL
MNEEASNKSIKVLFKSEAKKKLLEGASIVAQAVCCTLGPCGKTVLLQRGNNNPELTKDGVTVAGAIKLRDPVLRMGGDLLRDCASRTNSVAGDGTTTSTAIAFHMMQEAYKLLEAGYDAGQLITEVEKCKDVVLKILNATSRQVNTNEDITNIATISANGDKNIGELIAKAIDRVGKDGIVTVDEAKGMATTLEIVEGTQIERSFLSPYFVTHNDKMLCIYDDCKILITDKKITTLSEIVTALEAVQKAGQALLIIADSIEGEALQALVLNRVKANLKVVAINAPGIGQVKAEMLEDLACLTGAQVISSKKGTQLSDAAKYFGSMKKIIVSNHNTTFIGTTKSNVNLEARLNDLRTQLLDPTLSQEEVSIIRLRIARLAGGVAVLHVGGMTETEIGEKKYRIEDALNATRSAIAEGYVAGGGSVLYYISKNIESVGPLNGGEKIVLAGCVAPMKCICTNANKNFEVVCNKIELQNPTNDISDIGYNAREDVVCNLVEKGIIDPVRVERASIEHATSIAIAFLSLDACVYEEEN